MDIERDPGLNAPPLDFRPIRLPFGRSLLFLLCSLVLATWTWRYRHLFVDDPYITFRYARNLVEGQGLTFNPGERLEGYSNFTWMLLSAAFLKVGIHPFGATRVAGVVLGMATFALLCFTRSPREPGKFLFPVHSSALLAGCYPFLVWCSGGLETPLYGFLVLSLLIALARLNDAPSMARSVAVGGLALLLALTRPEGFVFAVALPIAGLIWFRDPRHRRALVVSMVVFAIPFALYTLWRYSYFGTVVPNTVSAKVGGSLKSSFRDGLGYLLGVWSRTTGLRLQGYFLGPAAVLVAFSLRGFLSAWRTRTDAHWPLLFHACVFVKLQALFILAVGGDWMPGFRFLAPMLPALVVIAGFGASRLHTMVAWPFIFFLLLASPFSARHERIQGFLFLDWSRTHASTEVEQFQKMAAEVRALAPPNATLAATEAGYLPYLTRLRFLDMLGLVDTEIARLHGGLHEKYNSTSILRRRPELILLGTHKQVDGTLAGLWAPDEQMLHDAAFLRDYKSVREWPRRIPDKDGNPLEGSMVLYRRQTEVQAEDSAS